MHYFYLVYFFLSEVDVVVPLIEEYFWDLLIMCATVTVPENGSLKMQSLKATECFIASSFLNLQVSRHQSYSVICAHDWLSFKRQPLMSYWSLHNASAGCLMPIISMSYPKSRLLCSADTLHCLLETERILFSALFSIL